MPSERDTEQLTLDEAADLLRISRHTLERWARTGRIPGELNPDGEWRFDRRQLLDRAVSIDDLPHTPE